MSSIHGKTFTRPSNTEKWKGGFLGTRLFCHPVSIRRRESIRNPLCPERLAPDLAGFIAQRLGDELEGSRNLVAHQTFSKMGDKRFLGHAVIRLFDNGVNEISHVFIGQTNDRAGSDTRKGLDGALYFSRVNIG